SMAYLYAQHASASGCFSWSGDAQYSRLVVYASTSDATPTTLRLGDSYYVTIPQNTSWGFTAYVVARSSTGSSAYWELKGLIKRGTGSPSIVGTVSKTKIAGDSDTSSWDVDVQADTTNNSLNIVATGVSGVSIHWVATINLTEVGY
ncbi:MAG TPA: hypothetical protein PKV21_06550, partial [bacterium]|nr:hypothetical protein [bacterium]